MPSGCPGSSTVRTRGASPSSGGYITLLLRDDRFRLSHRAPPGCLGEFLARGWESRAGAFPRVSHGCTWRAGEKAPGFNNPCSSGGRLGNRETSRRSQVARSEQGASACPRSLSSPRRGAALGPPFALKKAAERASSPGSETQQARRRACPRLPAGRWPQCPRGRGAGTVRPARRVRVRVRLGAGAAPRRESRAPRPPPPRRAAAATARPRSPPPTPPGWPPSWPLGAPPSTCRSARLHAAGSEKEGGCRGAGAGGGGRSVGGGGLGGPRPLPPDSLQLAFTSMAVELKRTPLASGSLLQPCAARHAKCTAPPWVLPAWGVRGGFPPTHYPPGTPDPAELTKDWPSERPVFQGKHGGSFPIDRLSSVCLMINLSSFVSFSGLSAFLISFFSAHPPVPLSHFRSCIFSKGQEEVGSRASFAPGRHFCWGPCFLFWPLRCPFAVEVRCSAQQVAACCG